MRIGLLGFGEAARAIAAVQMAQGQTGRAYPAPDLPATNAATSAGRIGD